MLPRVGEESPLASTYLSPTYPVKSSTNLYSILTKSASKVNTEDFHLDICSFTGTCVPATQALKQSLSRRPSRNNNGPDDTFVSVESKAGTVMACEEAGPDLGNEGAVGRRPKSRRVDTNLKNGYATIAKGSSDSRHEGEQFTRQNELVTRRSRLKGREKSLEVISIGDKKVIRKTNNSVCICSRHNVTTAPDSRTYIAIGIII